MAFHVYCCCYVWVACQQCWGPGSLRFLTLFGWISCWRRQIISSRCPFLFFFLGASGHGAGACSWLRRQCWGPGCWRFLMLFGGLLLVAAVSVPSPACFACFCPWFERARVFLEYEKNSSRSRSSTGRDVRNSVQYRYVLEHGKVI